MFIKIFVRCTIPIVKHQRRLNQAAKTNSILLFRQKKNVRNLFVISLTALGAVGIFIYNLPRVSNEKKQKLVILGSGWAAVSLIKTLKSEQYDITVVSPTNYFLYSPLLPSVTVGTVDARSLVEPIRSVLHKKHGIKACFLEAECIDLDTNKKEIICQDNSEISAGQFSIPYDKVVVAVGSQTATRNVVGIREHACMLKSVEDARNIRKKIMDSFETAMLPGQSDDEIKRLLTFVVVGGGPTGVEFAGELRDFMHNLQKFYPDSIMNKVNVVLVNSHYKILSMYDKQISEFAEQRFKGNNINVIQESYVVELAEKEMKIKSKITKEIATLPYGICVWAAGISPREITKKLIEKIPGQNNRNALVTDGYLRVRNTSNVFGIGDCATVEFSKLIDKVEELYRQADTDQSGELSLQEFSEFVEETMKVYPEMTQHLSKVKQGISKTFDELDVDKNRTLSFDEFKSFLLDVDNKLKAYPATAQVAAQQGKYLGQLLNNNNPNVDAIEYDGKPFIYSHLGSFAYVGGDRAVLQLPLIGSVTNWTTIWLWRAAYLNQAVSWRMEFLICLDWIKEKIFGRDTSRI